VHPGRVIADRFALTMRVGAGGMGEVWVAHDRERERAVAIKFVRDATPERVARFAREGRILAAVRHPAIVEHIAHGLTPEGEPYLVMAWLEGRDLGRVLAERTPSVGETLAMARRIAGALGAAHAVGVVHRDVKPSNVFVPHGDLARAVLLDFGVARELLGGSETRSGVTIGTPGYLAPEQIDGGAVDARADVFALGCVLYRCVAGAAAFEGGALAVLAKVLVHTPPRLDARPGATVEIGRASCRERVS
jgi:serine/threonine protein kinase